MDVSALPPMPDRYTGLPRPPHAPLERGWTPGDCDPDPRHIPDPPPGQGPVLEYYRPSKRHAIGTGLFVSVLAFLYGVLRTRGFGWMTTKGGLVLWLIILSPVPLYYSSLRKDRIAAGADWLSYRKRWVRTYELTEVTLKPSGPKLVLQLVDRDGRKLRIAWSYIQYNRALWDLVYNGILHSVYTSQVKTNFGGRKVLKLPDRTHP